MTRFVFAGGYLNTFDAFFFYIYKVKTLKC